jgi:hypothetical protein
MKKYMWISVHENSRQNHHIKMANKTIEGAKVQIFGNGSDQ